MNTPEKINILLVDDQPAKLLSYEAMLGSLGENLIRAGSAREALDHLLKTDIAVIVVDVCMPELDGFELAAMIRQHPRFQKTAIIFVSAVLMTEIDQLKGYECGAVDYLPVPIIPEVLRSKVAVFADLYRKTRLLERLNRDLEQRVAQQTAELEASTASLRESEERFRNMADNAPVMIWVAEPDASCTFLSTSWYEFTGMSPETGLGFGRVEAIHPEDRARARDAFIAAELRREPFRLEYRLRRNDGEYRWVIDAAAPRFAPDGRFLGYIGSVIDIGDRKQMEEALKDADRRKDEFLATLSHELRNPLAPIRNAVEILRLESQSSPEMSWPLGVIDRQTRQMTRLIDDLLEVSRITRNRLELRKERVDLANVVQVAVETCLPLIKERGQRLSISLPADPIPLDADVARLAQVFSNLLNNAAKYSAKGAQIWLSAERRGSEVFVTVKDEGLGISADMLPKVFEMFTQVDRYLERAGGLGIGLTLVKRLVEMHGGSTSAKSEGPGKGSEFTVRLPLAIERAEAPVKGDKAKEQTPRSSLRILVVDDNRDSADTLGTMLRLAGNDIRTAYDGLAAVEAASAFRPHVVLLDIGMPILNGCDAARRIREQPWGKDVVLIAMTGWGQEKDKHSTKEAGFDHHLVKHVAPAALMQLLADLPLAARAAATVPVKGAS